MPDSIDRELKDITSPNQFKLDLSVLFRKHTTVSGHLGFLGTLQEPPQQLRLRGSEDHTLY